MRDYKEQIDEVAALMDEFGLTEATMTLAGFTVSFRRYLRPSSASSHSSSEAVYEWDEGPQESVAPQAETAKGTPVSSPMSGIFYLSSSPGSPPFVKQGESVSVGQTIGLIEAMKVFNEIPSPVSGVVLEIAVESGALVQAGEVILRIG